MNRPRRPVVAVPVLLLLALTLALTPAAPILAQGQGVGPGGQGAPEQLKKDEHAHKHKEVSRGPITPEVMETSDKGKADKEKDKDKDKVKKSKELKQAKDVPDVSVVKDVQDKSVDPIDAKILVIAADGTESVLPVIRRVLDFVGTPYTEWVASERPGQLTMDKLIDPANSLHGYYQGVILTTGDLGYDNNGTWMSALTPAEWQNLWTYESAFNVRQVSWYTFPTAAYGLQPPSQGSDAGGGYAVNYTAAGKAIFGSYVNTNTPVTIKNAWTYLAKPLADGPEGTTTPLLTDGAGNALAVVRTYPTQNNRQALALTFDGAPWLTHSLVLSYGVLNWVTKGIFLGERRVYLGAQIDDLFLENDIWVPGIRCGGPTDNTGVTYRMSGADLLAAKSWQEGRRGQNLTRNLRLSFAYNGFGYKNPTDYPNDTLSPQVDADSFEFWWINHTFEHPNLGGPPYDVPPMAYNDVLAQITRNNTVANNIGLGSRFNKLNLVTPQISGLANPDAMRAAADSGVRYLVSDSSRGGQNYPSPNAGIVNGLDSRILMIPRRPNNLFYNVSTPAEWVGEYNAIYGLNGCTPPPAGWGRNLSYEEILDKESDVLLTYLLDGEIGPWMFHQANVRAYDGTRTLLTDLLDRTISKYNQYYTLPIQSPRMDELGVKVAERMAFSASGVTALLGPGQSITLRNPGSASVKVPVTGLRIAGAQQYGGQWIAYVTLAAGETKTFASDVSAAPTSLTFAARRINTTSPAQTVTLTNRGTSAATISSIGFTGSNPLDFARSGGTCQVGQSTLAAGASCTINVTFRPRVTGARSANLSIANDLAVGETPLLIPLSGTGNP